MSTLYQPGDRLLVASGQLGSRALRWWLNSAYSHVVPVLDVAGTTLEIRPPRPKFGSVAAYRAGKHRLLHLRPVVPWAPAQISAYLAAAEQLRVQRYDLLSFAGFLLNRPKIEDGKRVNCSEGMLVMDHAAGLLTGRTLALVSPQSYVEFASAGLFTIIGRS